MLKLLKLILINLLIFLLIKGDLSAKEYIAFSLKTAQKVISSSPKTNYVRVTFPDLFRLSGITNIEGAIYDKKKENIIIIGSKKGSLPLLNLDDLVVILRSILIYGRQPYVSLSPAKSGDSWDVYLGRGIKNTHVGNELINVALSLQKMSADVLDPKRSLDLLLISVVPKVQVKKNILIIKGFKQYILTNPREAIAVLQKRMKNNLFPRLKVISQLIALAQGIDQMGINKGNLWFWLKDYKPRPVITPKEVKFADNSNRIPCAIMALGIVSHPKKTHMKRLRKLVLKTRPKKENVSWKFDMKEQKNADIYSKDMEKAIDMFSEAIYLHKVKKSFYKAIDLYTKIIKIKSDWNLPYYFRAAIYNELKKYKKAIKDYEQAIEMNSRYPMAYIDKGYAYNYMSMHKKAIKELDKAIEMSPYHIDAYTNRGIAYCGMGNYERGILDFDNVIKIAPNFEIAYINKGKAYFCLGQYKKAIGILNKAIEIAPNLSEAYCNRGIAYRYLGKYGNAIQDFNKAIQMDPYYAYAYVQRGLTYEDLCQWKKADRDIEMAVQLDPRIFSAYIFGVMSLSPRTAVEYHERGHAYFFTGQWKKAIADFDKAIQLRKGFASAYFYRGLSYDNLRDYKKAILDYTQAIKLIPNDAIMYNNRGTAYYSSHEYEKALEDFNKAINLEPNNVVFYENRVRVYTRLGKNKKACEDARRACELGRCKFYRTLKKRGVCK